VLSPFMGIGSEGYCSLKAGRKFIGTELKESYWRQACEYLRGADAQGDMFARNTTALTTGGMLNDDARRVGRTDGKPALRLASVGAAQSECGDE